MSVTQIICGGPPDHECNDDDMFYEQSDGNLVHFKADEAEKAETWYNENYKTVVMGSTGCSICGSKAIDRHNWMFDE